MLGLSRIIDAAQVIPTAPRVTSMTITRERCTRYRHHASTCSRCADLCSSAALSLAEHHPVLDSSRCTECGACASVCPTEAIEATAPSDKELSAEVCAQAIRHGSVTLACKQASSRPESASSVTCLARLDLSMLLLAVAKGATNISLLTGACSECASGTALPYICNTVAAVEGLTKALGVPIRVSIEASVAAPVLQPENAADVDLSRRSFFTTLGTRGAEYTAQAATSLIPGTSRPAHRSAARKDLVAYLPQKRTRFVESLRVLTSRTPTPSATVLFSTSKLDATQCIGCSMCADLCPTGAMAATEEDGMLRITSDAADCVACKLCVDSCSRHAVSLRPDDGGILNSARAVVFEQRKNTDLLASTEDRMSRLLGVSLSRT
jgi:formate hydrogenlyase subunit 6/NADH:ubiquinone oxidoreductase subunit I